MRLNDFSLILFFTLICGYSCDSNSVNQVEENQVLPQNNIVKPPYCDEISINKFNKFLNFRFGDDEQLITSRLGKMSNGYYSEDSTVFIYNFDRVPRVPIQVWVNARSNKVCTIFMEILSLADNFESDLEQAIDAYNLKSCDYSWFGMTASEIKNELGEPTHDVYTKEYINELTYYSESGAVMAAFKLYPQQDTICSSVAVSWFYD